MYPYFCTMDLYIIKTNLIKIDFLLLIFAMKKKSFNKFTWANIILEYAILPSPTILKLFALIRKPIIINPFKAANALMV